MRFLFLLPLLWVQISSAWAEDYYWTVPYPDGKVKYQSAVAACTANNQFYIDRDSGKYARFDKKNVVIDSGHWSCGVVAYALNSKGVEYVAANFSNVANRRGDSCPADTEYNKETGECKENKCKILQGSLYEKGGHQAPIPRFINYLGCEIAVSAIDGCIGPAEGETGGTFCRVIGSFTGNWFTSNGSCAFGCDVGPGDGSPPGGDGGTGGDGGSNPPGGDGGSDGGTKPGGG
ncbi:coat protein A, partial [Pseudomonas aeruginosa]